MCTYIDATSTIQAVELGVPAVEYFTKMELHALLQFVY
jgi:hypothetical protein